MTEYKLYFAKWLDPFGDDIDFTAQKVMLTGNELTNEDDEDEEYNDLDMTNEVKLQNNSKLKLVQTPMGLVPITERSYPSRIFNFWVGNANFNISEPIAQIIEKTPGVESLCVYTRYRFRIAIGRLFRGGEVMADIQKRVLTYLNGRKSCEAQT